MISRPRLILSFIDSSTPPPPHSVERPPLTSTHHASLAVSAESWRLFLCSGGVLSVLFGTSCSCFICHRMPLPISMYIPCCISRNANVCRVSSVCQCKLLRQSPEPGYLIVFIPLRAGVPLLVLLIPGALDHFRTRP